jgi:hypothetical protein
VTGGGRQQMFKQWKRNATCISTMMAS